MKRIIAIIILCCSFSSLFFAASRPSMDGRAIVAEIGELPSGLFAKSSGFLPGDTVLVTNPSTKTTVEVMIFGSFDATEGIAIILSPEAAKELFISKGSNIVVQVTKKSDGYVEGTILAKTIEAYKPEIDPDTNPELLIDSPEFNKKIEEAVIEEITPQEKEPIEIVVKDASLEEDKNDIISVTIVDEKPIIEEKQEDTVPVEIAETELVVEEKEDTVPVEIKEIEPIVEKKEDIVPVEIAETEPEIEEFEEDIVPVETAETEIIKEEKGDTVPVEIAETETIIEEKEEQILTEIVENVSSNIGDDVLLDDEMFVTDIVPEDEFVVDLNKDIEPKKKEEEAIAEVVENPVIETEKAISEEVSTSEEIIVNDKESAEIQETVELVDIKKDEEIASVPVLESNIETDTEVILIPTDLNPPVNENSSIVISLDDSEISDEPEVVVVSSPVEELEIIKETTIKSDSIPIITSAKLDRKSVYIQIATYYDIKNVEKIIDMYGIKYPIVVLKENNESDNQVLVGPLNEDEYPVVLTRFKNFGFEDAFRRISR